MVKILAVEKDWWDRKRLKSLLKKAMPDAELCVFENTSEALAFAKENKIDAAFIDFGRSVQIPGYFLAKDILKIQKTNIIFTNYEWKHLQDALELRVSGYLQKPLQYKDVLDEFQNLRYPFNPTDKMNEPMTFRPKRGRFNQSARIY